MKIFARLATLAFALGLVLAHWQLFPNSSELATSTTLAQTVSVEPLPLQVHDFVGHLMQIVPLEVQAESALSGVRIDFDSLKQGQCIHSGRNAHGYGI